MSITHVGREQMMKFRTYVEPPEPMRGLEVPPEVVEALGRGKRPAVTIAINGPTWRSRVAIMRGRYLLGLSIANRQAAGVATGDEVVVELQLDTEPRWWTSRRTLPAPWTPIRSPGPPTTGRPTATSGDRCTPSRPRRNPRPANGGSTPPWPRYAARSRQGTSRPRPPNRESAGCSRLLSDR